MAKPIAGSCSTRYSDQQDGYQCRRGQNSDSYGRWWINLTFELMDLEEIRYHIIILNGFPEDANQVSAKFPIGMPKLVDVAGGRCDPNSGRNRNWGLFLLVFGFIVCLVNLYRIARDWKCDRCSVCQNCNVGSLLLTFLILSVVPLAIIPFTFPNCSNEETAMCSRPGTYPLPRMNAQWAKTICTSKEECTVMWKLRDGGAQINLVTLDGTCQEKTLNKYDSGTTRFVLVNPSTRMDCNEVPEEETSFNQVWVAMCTSGGLLGLLALIGVAQRIRTGHWVTHESIMQMDENLDQCCISFRGFFFRLMGCHLVQEVAEDDEGISGRLILPVVQNEIELARV